MSIDPKLGTRDSGLGLPAEASAKAGTRVVGIIARDLVKEYETATGVFRAVDGLSFRCGPGEVYGLLGPNGAGKTTTIRMLATLQRPTSGDAVVAGASVLTRPAAVRASIGYLTADTKPYERLTAREQVVFFGRLHGLSRAEAEFRAAALLREFDLEEAADRPVGRLSTGMRQKAALARTLVHDPPVLLLDEPTAGLDVLVARRVVDYVRAAKARGRAILLSTHGMLEAERLCDRVGIVWKGKLRDEGTLEELRSRWGRERLDDVFFRIAEAAEGGRVA